MSRDDERESLDAPGAILHGAIGGTYGAGAMSILRLAMYRAGVIDKMVPQVTQEWMSDRTGAGPAGGSKTSHHIVDQLLHLGYGAAVGAVWGPLLTGRGRKSLCRDRPRLWAVGRGRARVVSGASDRTAGVEVSTGRERHQYRRPPSVRARRTALNRRAASAARSTSDVGY